VRRASHPDCSTLGHLRARSWVLLPEYCAANRRQPAEYQVPFSLLSSSENQDCLHESRGCGSARCAKANVCHRGGGSLPPLIFALYRPEALR
jgi:hypothetical protein